MIQRIQSLFLLGAVLISTALFFLPFSEKNTIDPSSGQSLYYVMHVTKIESLVNTIEPFQVTNNYPVLVINIFLIAIAIVTIFLYNNRPNQIRLCMLGALAAMILLVLVFYFSDKMGDPSIKAHYLPGIYLVPIQIILFLAARRFIRKDEMLVKAADRIR